MIILLFVTCFTYKYINCLLYMYLKRFHYEITLLLAAYILNIWLNLKGYLCRLNPCLMIALLKPHFSLTNLQTECSLMVTKRQWELMGWGQTTSTHDYVAISDMSSSSQKGKKFCHQSVAVNLTTSQNP